MNKILIVEDELAIARFLSLELEHEGFEVFVEPNGISGLKEAQQKDYSLIILDVMLPGMNGIEVLRRLRQTKKTPVIILTARDQVVDKVEGLDLGADDYMTKPFAIEELLARIRRILKIGEKKGIIVYKGLELDLDTYRVKYHDSPIDLTKKEFELLVYMLQNTGRAISREQILTEVWGYQYIGKTNVVDVFVRYIRQKIDNLYGIKTIETARGVGYLVGTAD